MNTRTLLVSAGLLVVVYGSATSQPTLTPPVSVAAPPNKLPKAPSTLALPEIPLPPNTEARATPQPPSSILPPAPPLPTAPRTSTPPPAPPAEKSVDDLLTELERVQLLKADLDKKEQELKAAIRKKLELQTERLKKLGGAPQETKPFAPPPAPQGIPFIF